MSVSGIACLMNRREYSRAPNKLSIPVFKEEKAMRVTDEHPTTDPYFSEEYEQWLVESGLNALKRKSEVKISVRKIDSVILHCAETPDYGDDFGFKDINEWHAENGWLDKASGISCGYHWVVRRSGVVEQGRPMSSQGAHCRGYNENSVGIVTMSTRLLARPQLLSLLNLCAFIAEKNEIEARNFQGHYEYNERKTCPGHDMVIFRELLRMRRGPNAET